MDCDDCEYNGVWDDETDGRIYDEAEIKSKGLVRNEATEEGVCALLGVAGEGCWQIECTRCGYLGHSISTVRD